MNARVIIFRLLLLVPATGFSQYLSNNGDFSLSEIRGCAPLTVTFTNLRAGECTGGSPCDVKFEVTNTISGCVAAYVASPAVPAVQNPAIPFTFTQPGTYRVITLYQGALCDELTVTVTPNIQPDFNIYTCGGFLAQVQVTDTNYDSYIINFNDGSPEVTVPRGPAAVATHAFAPGPNSVSVRGIDTNADDNCSSRTKPFLALATLPAPFISQLEVMSTSQIDLDFPTAEPNIVYRLEIATNNNSTFQVAHTVYNSTTATQTNVQTNQNFYCFRLGAFDPCNNTIVYSNIICSANFSATAQNNQNLLTWTTNTTGVSNFSINRDGSIIGNAFGSPFIDNSVTCNTTYCYQLRTNYANGSRSLSMPVCVTAQSTNIPTPILDATAVVSGSVVNLTWQQNVAFQPDHYNIFRKEGSGNFRLISTTPGQAFTDVGYSPDVDICYQINYVDVCGNVAPMSAEICLIRLEGSLNSENHTVLTWTSYTGWQNGVSEYVIEKYSEDGQLLQTVTVGPGTNTYIDEEFLPDQQVVRYVVKANPVSPGLGQAVSNEIIIIKQAIITFPTAFTPDNQGPVENEIFRVFGQYVATFEMQIFNRWGEMIFATTDIDVGWDGKYRGQDVPDGTYAFIARLTDLSGQRFTRSGSVLLIRKK
jgi:gliding motility-associated-like protein